MKISHLFLKAHHKGIRKNTQPYSLSFKRKLINEYLKKDVTFDMLATKYGMHRGIISRWVRVCKNGKPIKPKPTFKINKFQLLVAKEQSNKKKTQAENSALKKELKEALLKNHALEKMIQIAEEHYKIPIRKKPGSKRSTR